MILAEPYKTVCLMDSILGHGQTQFLEHVYFFRSLVQIFKNIFSDPEFWRTLYIDKFSP